MEKNAGNHLGGYTGFQIEITPYLQCGNNLIAIRVNNLWRADIAPRAGEHTFLEVFIEMYVWYEKVTTTLIGAEWV